MRRSMPIRGKIILSSVAILCAAVTIIGIFFWSTFYRTLTINAYDNLNSSILRVEENLRSNFDQVENTLFTFFNTETFREWKGNSLDLHPPKEGEKTIEEQKNYNIIMNVQKDISSILMFNNTWSKKIIHSSYVIIDEVPVQLHVSRSFISDNDENFRKVYEQIKDQDFQTYYLPPTSSNNFVYVAKKFSNITKTKELTFISSLDPRSFANEMHQLPEEDITASLTDENGIVYFSTDEKLLGQKSQFDQATLTPIKRITNGYETVLDGKRQLVVQRQLKDSKFSIVVSAPASIVSDQVLESMMGYVVIIIVVLVVFTILSITLSSVFTRFFIDITGRMNKIREKDYNVTMPAYKEKDLNIISTTFNSMTTEIRTLIQTVYQEKLLLKEADIKQLQSQMNPHFLMNTLTTISTMALLHQDQLLYQMMSALTEILDASLSNTTASSTFIPISQELEYINCYLYLQQIRFQDKLRYHINVEDDALLKLYIPRLSVEPLVENAVVHGIEGNVELGVVDISIIQEEDHLLITIQDNGKGFDVDAVLNDDQHTSTKGHNISIKNTNQRLKLIFGERYGVEFESELGVKTIARMKLPVVKEPYFNEELI